MSGIHQIKIHDRESLGYVILAGYETESFFSLVKTQLVQYY